MTARRGGKKLPMNIDGATAVVYSELGFPPPLGRGLFILSRSVGILAHAWEQSGEGAAVPLVIVSHRAREFDVQSAIREVNRYETTVAPTRVIRIEAL